MTPAEQINRPNLLAKVPCESDCSVLWKDTRPGTVRFFHLPPTPGRPPTEDFEVYEDDGNIRAGWLSEAMAWLTSFHEEEA